MKGLNPRAKLTDEPCSVIGVEDLIDPSGIAADGVRYSPVFKCELYRIEGDTLIDGWRVILDLALN